MYKIGIHQSFDGFGGAVYDAASIGANVYQIFTRNNRNLKSRTFMQDDYKDFSQAKVANPQVLDCVVHAPYSLNPASGDEVKRQRARDIIASDLRTLNNLDGDVHYVLHPGASTDFTTFACIENLVKTMHELKPYFGKVIVALETMAGQGTQLMSTLAQIGTVLGECYDLDNVRLCVDTCHIYAAGFTPEQVVAIVDLFGNMSDIDVIHVNDSAREFGSCVDRHASLLRGYIGAGIRNFIKVLHDANPEAPIILETPVEGIMSDFDLIRRWTAEVQV